MTSALSLEVLNDPSTPPHVQPFACVQCWKRKKKCNKLAPSCSRCISNQEQCAYSSLPPTRRLGGGPTPGHTPHTIEVLFPKGSSTLVLPPLISLTPPLSYISSHVLSYKTDNILNAQLHIIFTSVKDQIPSICSLYLRTFNTWIPIIIENQLREHISQVDDPPRPEICALLISIYIITHTSTTVCEGPDPIYFILKRIYSTLNPSVESIQAGVLISVYEHGQDLDQESYLTIGSCARMGNAMGMHTTLYQSPPVDPVAQNIFETHKHIWWSIIIVERVLAFKTIQSRRPFACQDPLISDHLPGFYGQDLGVELPVGILSDLAFPTFQPSNPYARTVQATYILGLVFLHITSHHNDHEFLRSQVIYLDKIIQTFALSALEQGNNDQDFTWGHSCGAFFIAVSALWILHDHNLSTLERNATALESTSISSLALQSLTRNFVETARNKVDDSISGARFAPSFILPCLQWALKFHIMMRPERAREDEWAKDLKDMISYLRIAGHKWRFAQEFINLCSSQL